MKPAVSVIICTHNPRQDYLVKVLANLQSQTLPKDQWELLIIDNASQASIGSQLNLNWHSNVRVIRENQLGLTPARLRGFREAAAELIVFVDDDNVLETNYLSQVLQIFQQHPGLGAIAGKSLPEFEVTPEPWVAEFYKVLALRDFGEKALISPATFGAIAQNLYPEFAPGGIGLALQRRAFAAYAEQVAGNKLRLALGRMGKQLIAGEDNDIVLTLLNAGWGVGYFPQLRLTHLIPASYLGREYLAQLNYASSRSWVQVLGVHGLRMWKKIPRWTVLPRQIKAFFRYQPWRNSAAYVRWRGICGMFEGRSVLP